MARHTASQAAGEIRFPNGTVLQLPQPASATQWTAEPGRLRSGMLPAEDDTSVRFRAALAENGIREQETLHVDAAPAPARLRGRNVGRDYVHLRPAPAPPGEAQVILYQDESGGLSWHFANPLDSGEARLRSAASDAFVIPLRTAHTAAALESPHGRARLRGPITKWGRKIFKVLLVPLESLAAPAVVGLVRQMEEKHRQELIRAITPENFAQLVTEPFQDWPRLAGRRSLLIVHGLFSTTHGTLVSFPKPAMDALCARYEGRVIGFDQITVSRSPEENARYFLETIKAAAKPGERFEFDILCHSRGGVVARTLAERGEELVPQHPCAFRKVFFVASPNNGSVLGDPAHIVEMLDTFTNLLTWFPDGPVLYSIEVLLAIVKLVAHTAERRLPGLAAMGTDGYIQRVLNRGTVRSPAHYAAAASDYAADPQAANSLLTGALGDRLLDRVFTADGRRAANDLVVPCDGVHAANGHPSFPISDPLIFHDAEGVWHCNFFQQPRVLARIEEHFREDGAIPIIHAAESTTPARPRFRGSTTASRVEVSPKVPAGEPPAELRREPQIDFHEQVQEGEANDLIVRLEDVLAGSTAPALTLALAPGETNVRLAITLNAPGFEVTAKGDAAVVLQTPRNPASENATFTLTARHPGPNPVRREIRVDFWRDGSPIGAVRHRTFVIPKNFQGPQPSDGSGSSFGLVLPAGGREGCEFTLFIEGDDLPGQQPFSVRMSSQIPGREYEARRAGKFALDTTGGASAAEHVQQIYRKQFALFPGDHLSDAEFAQALPKWEENFNRELDALGRTLWQRLPQPFRDEYFALYQDGVSPRSILIHSDETVVPWELAVPHATIGGKFVVLEPLGTAHILGRWQPGLHIKPHPQRLAVRDFCVVQPAYGAQASLASAAAEVGALRQLFPRIRCISPATCDSVHRELLDRGDVQIFHYTGHGTFDPGNADLNALALEDGELSASLITGSRLAGESQPIVFLNACSVGSSGVVIGRMGGFVANFLNSGASGVIAAYWPVLDDRAQAFALALYQKLKLGRAIGEALQELRQDHPRDPNYRAFAYFGDPWARVNLSALS